MHRGGAWRRRQRQRASPAAPPSTAAPAATGCWWWGRACWAATWASCGWTATARGRWWGRPTRPPTTPRALCVSDASSAAAPTTATASTSNNINKQHQQPIHAAGCSSWASSHASSPPRGPSQPPQPPSRLWRLPRRPRAAPTTWPKSAGRWRCGTAPAPLSSPPALGCTLWRTVRVRWAGDGEAGGLGALSRLVVCASLLNPLPTPLLPYPPDPTRFLPTRSLRRDRPHRTAGRQRAH